MASRPAQLLTHLRRLAPALEAPDTELLARFASRRDEEAFAVLVGRHGPMVLAVCRRLLADSHSADDAFQATFLVLARRAGSLRRPEALGAWLHGVARRVALRARTTALKRQRRTEGDAANAADPRPDPLSAISARELLDALDEEVDRLPEAYRLPLILCCLEGHTREEAARLLGWAPGSVKGRLERGRARLHDRLTRRGLVLPVLLLAPLAAAAVPATLAAATAKAAVAFVGGGKMPSATAVVLARRFLEGTLGSKLGLLALLLLTAGLLAGYRPPAETSAARPDEAKVGGQKPVAEVPLPAGAAAQLGSLRWKHAARVGVVAFAPTGNALASTADDGTVILWDRSTGVPLHRLGWARHNFGERAACLAFSPDGKTLATGHQDFMGIQPGWEWPRVTLWDVASGREIKGLWKLLRDGSVRSVAFSPDGKLLAAADDAGAVRIWETASGKERYKIDPTKGISWGLAFAPDSKGVFLFSRAGRDNRGQAGAGEVYFWDLTSGKRECRFVANPQRFIGALAISPDGRTMAVLAGDKTALFETATGKKRCDLLPGEDVRSLAFAPDGKSLALGGYRSGQAGRVGATWLVNPATGRGRLLAAKYAASLAFSSDGKVLAGGGWDFTVRLWEVATGKAVAPTTGCTDAVTCVSFAPDRRTVVAGDKSGVVRVWDAATGAERLRRRLETGYGGFAGFDNFNGFGQVGVTPAGKVLASRNTPMATFPGQAFNRVLLWDVTVGRALLEVAPDERARRGLEVCTVSFSPDGRMAARGEFSVVVLWDILTGKERRRLRGNEGNVYCTRFSQDGRSLASCHSVGSANRILVWDVATGKERGRISSRILTTFAISPDGRRCATGDSSLIRLWDVASGKMLRTITTPMAPVHCLAFAPDGRLLASGDSVGGLFLCDPETGEEVLRASGHQGAVTALAFDGDRRLASASLDTTVLVWDLATLALAPAKPSAEELEKAWDDLARQARPAYRAHWILRNAPNKALALLRQRLHAAETVARERLRRLIAELDSDRFAVRERATGELARLGTAAEAALRAALTEAPTLELRKRATNLLAQLRTDAAGERRRALRCVFLLECLGTGAARSLLERLAGGEPTAPQTQAAKAALERLARRAPRR